MYQAASWQGALSILEKEYKCGHYQELSIICFWRLWRVAFISVMHLWESRLHTLTPSSNLLVFSNYKGPHHFPPSRIKPHISEIIKGEDRDWSNTGRSYSRCYWERQLALTFSDWPWSLGTVLLDWDFLVSYLELWSGSGSGISYRFISVYPRQNCNQKGAL